MKFTPFGNISLNLLINNEVIEMAVTDTGIGITPDEMRNLFQPFERADRVKSLSIEGTGLGFSIARHLVEAHSNT